MAASSPARSPVGEIVPVTAVRRTDVTALVGSLIWIAVAFAVRAGQLELFAIELFLALAFLALVPLVFRVLAPHVEAGDTLYTAIVIVQLPAAIAATIGLSQPTETTLAVVLVLPWTALTVAMGLLGLRRLRRRGLKPLPALAIDVALLYAAVGGAFLAFYALGVGLGFDSITVLLTVVHYHFAGLVLLVVLGLSARQLAPGDDRLPTTRAGKTFTVAIGTTIVGIAAVAVGIASHPAIELVAVLVLVGGIVLGAVATLRWVLPTVPPIVAAFLGIAWIAVAAGALLGLAAVTTGFLDGHSLSLSTMVRWHGMLNGILFGAAGLIAFRLQETLA